MSRGQLQAHRLLADHGIEVEPSDLMSDGFGQFIAETEDGRFVVSLGGYPQPFVEKELPTKRLGVRQRVRLERPMYNDTETVKQCAGEAAVEVARAG